MEICVGATDRGSYPPQTRSDLMSAMIATLGAGYLQVINYWFSRPKEP